MSASRVQYRPLLWERAVRIIPSRYPPAGLFDRVAAPDDLDAVFYVESLTNPRLRQEWGELSLVEPEERIAGPGTTPIMAAFTHPNPQGSRFSSGDYGVYYAADEETTAIAETVHHRERFLRYSSEAPLTVQMRMYVGRIQARLVDIRGLKDTLRDIYNPDSYAASQSFGRLHRAESAWGIAYDSVRREGGRCVAVFRPRAVQPVVPTRHLQYVWDGKRITDVLEITSIPWK